MACLPPGDMMISLRGDATQGHVLSMALTLMWGSVLMSMTPLTSEGLAQLYAFWATSCKHALSMDMPQQGVGVFSKPVLPSRTITTARQDLLLRDISGSMTLLQQVSGLKSQIPVAIELGQMPAIWAKTLGHGAVSFTLNSVTCSASQNHGSCLGPCCKHIQNLCSFQWPVVLPRAT